VQEICNCVWENIYIMAKNNVKKILTEEGYTQTQLSISSKVSVGSVNKICNQHRQCAPKTNHKILKGLNLLIGKNFKYEEVFPNTQKY
jgi:hypothetical protein